MKDSNYDRPEKDNSEEVPIFSDRDLEDHLKVGEEYSRGEETPKEGNPSPQILVSLKRQRRSRRSLILIVLLCFVLGILGLAVFFTMKPEVRKPQIVAKRIKRPIPSIEREEEPAIPGAVGKKGMEEKPLEGGIPEGEKLSGQKPPEIPLMSRERGPGKKVIIIGGTKIPKGKEEEDNKVTEVEGKKPDMKGKQEVKPQFAKAEKPEIRAMAEPKLPIGRFTINVGSFRERARAERLMKELEGKGYEAFVAKAAIPQKGTWYRVSVGRFSSRAEAEAFTRTLKEKDGLKSFVRKLTETER